MLRILSEPGREKASKWQHDVMNTPVPDDDEMRRFVARLFGRDEPDASSPSADPDAALRNLTGQLFGRPDPDNQEG